MKAITMNKLTIKQLAESDRPREKMMQKGAEALQLAKWEVRDFARFKGMGPAKSITVMAALELGKRRNLQAQEERLCIKASTDIYNLFHPLLCDLPTEEFWVLLLNQAGKVIDKVRISRGGIDQTTADVRSILREALIQRATQTTQIALIHNHPSGNVRPSNDDLRLTQVVQRAAQTMNIRLIDHLIITDGHYFSFNDEGHL